MGTNKLYRLTEEDYLYFCMCVDKWIEVYGLHEWEVTTAFEELEDVIGKNSSDSCAMQSTITLSSVWSQTYGSADLDDTAHHEVLELLLMPMRITMGRIITDQGADRLVHTVIQHLMNAYKRGKIRVD